MQVPVLAVVALVPVLITPNLLFYFDITPKIVVLLLSVSAMLCFCDRNVNNIRALLETAPGRWFVALLGASWLSAAVSTALSTQPQLSLNGSSWRRYGLASDTALLLFAYPDFYHESPHNMFPDALTAQGMMGMLPGMG